MSSSSEAEDYQEQSNVPSQNYYYNPSKVSRLSDSGDDEQPLPPAKRMRSSTSFGASSQSSSGGDYNSASDHQSQPESDNEAPPSFGGFQYQAPVPNKPETSSTKNKVGGIGERMLKNAGYVEGTGLGKHGQGRVEPVEAAMQRGRTGLGFQAFSKGRGYEGPDYDPSNEIISAEEKVIWMESSLDEKLDRDTLEDWMGLGPRKMTIDDELEFCDEGILQDVLSLKTRLDTMTGEDLRRVRSMCNPYEKIGSAFFINRAALKMANMDAVFGHMFTNPRDRNNHPLVASNELLYFADVCAGPGGFTEYILWKKKWLAKGFGFTLKCKNDFKLADLHACSTETFTPYYGAENDGDIFNPLNLESLKDFVLKNTNGIGVHFMMADGGFSVEGQENIQEILSKQLYLCQCLAALSIVRTGGNFLVKLFDVFTEFSVGLVYLMYKSFDKISIHKPNTSRPANSERYLICKGKRKSSEEIEGHLAQVNRILCKYNKKNNEDVIRLVPLDVIKADRAFYNYICDSNNRIGELQKLNLLKVVTYHSNPTKFKETRHAEMRAACLKLWGIPDQPKSSQQPVGDEEAIKSILKTVNTIPDVTFSKDGFMNILKFRPKVCQSREDIQNIKSRLQYKLDWKFVYLNNNSEDKSENKFTFYLGSAGCNVYELVGSRWRINYDVKLPADTLVLAEKVQENSREGHAMKRQFSLHIIDAIILGGICVLHKSLEQRYSQIALFCTAHAIPQMIQTNTSRLPIRCKKLFDFKDFTKEISNLDKRQVKKLGLVNTTAVPHLHDNSDLYFVTKSLLLIKTIKPPWVKVFSKRHERPYFFHVGNNKSCFDSHPGMLMNVFDCMNNYIEYSNLQKEELYRNDDLFHTLINCSEAPR